MRKRKYILIYILAILTLFCISSNVLAAEENTLNYQPSSVVQYNENSLAPITSTSKLKKSGLATNLSNLLTKLGVSLPSKYKTEGMLVKNQYSTTECWAFAYTSAFEAINLKRSGSTDIYSPRHIDYSCSKSFTDVTQTENLFNRETSESGGNYFLATSYASSGKGPVLESDMPFENDTNKKISYSELNKTVQKQLDEIIFFPSIYKSYGTSEIYHYADSAKKVRLTTQEVIDIRNSIKEQIMNNGGVVANIYDEGKINVCRMTEDTTVNHGIFIVGWDDEYQATGWRNKGAYIVLNSYGTQNYDNGYCYISYDDACVETSIMGISKTSDFDVENVYEYDVFGGTTAIIPDNNKSEICGFNVFNRDTSKTETMKEIGIYTFSYQKAEVYFSDEFNQSGMPINFRKVANTTDTLSPGFITIQLDNEVTLNKNKFAIGVRFIENNTEGEASFAVEVANAKWWANVSCNKGESYLTNSFTADSSSTQFGELSYNLCIKAYTSKEAETPDPSPSPSPSPSPTPKIEISSTKYDVTQTMISKVPVGTQINEFKENIIVTGSTYTIIDSSGKEITNGLMKTGYKVKISNGEYPISVIADISGDGLADILDLARLRAHLVQRKGYILTGVNLKSADLSGDGKVDILDLARLRKLLVQ